MAKTPDLLNDDGSVSMATLLLMSHHAFRRDLAGFAQALPALGAGDAARAVPLREEWTWYHGALHGHHHMEDSTIFPDLLKRQPALGPVVERLTAQHRQIDPLLKRGDRAFAGLPAGAPDCARVVGELSALLNEHLTLEEAEVVQYLRGAREFPVPGTDGEAEQYAQGFAWSFHGVAPDVLEKVTAMLPGNLTARLPAARAAFEERCLRVWGSAKAGASRTAVPMP